MMYPRWYQQRNMSTFPGAVIAWIRCQAQLTQTDVDLEEISAAQHADFLGRVLLATGENGAFWWKPCCRNFLGNTVERISEISCAIEVST